ncbi:MAG: YggS family pyridoxal phosphate-dependent enzyme [Candidatus Margulisiibacteriota bacterium]
MTTSRTSEIAHNVQTVRDDIDRFLALAKVTAARPHVIPAQAGIQFGIRSLDLVAVIKSATLSDVEALVAAGITDVAENRVQSAMEKQNALGRLGVAWHLIGHLQSNKVKQAVTAFDMIQSIDSLALAEKLDTACAQANKVMPVLVQVKVAQEETKYGVPPGQLESLVVAISKLSHLKLRGLMAMASFTDIADQVRKEFHEVRRLFNQFRMVYNDFDTLSMGMSQDYPLAILEGSTMIRVGQRLIK